MTDDQVPVCALPDCDAPAVATVTVSAAGIWIRSDRLGRPRLAAAWAKRLRCWGHVTAAVDAHLTGATA